MFTKDASGKIGKIRNRACTRDFKLVPIFRKTRELVGKPAMLEWRRRFRPELKEWSAYKKAGVAYRQGCGRTAPAFPREAWDRMQAAALVVQLIGISTDEISRMKPSRDPWMRSEFPLIDLRMNRAACIKFVETITEKTPPKSACTFCPYHDDTEWLRLKTEEPEAFEQAAAFEEQLQAAKAKSENFKTTPYLHRSGEPIREVDFAGRLATREAKKLSKGVQLDLFTEECLGMCGL